jgi:hypothetical protein
VQAIAELEVIVHQLRAAGEDDEQGRWSELTRSSTSARLHLLD